MAYDFSLTQDPFTPVRPQKIEQLFSPSPLRTNNRIVNDITYQLAAVPKTCDGDQTTWALPDNIQRFPRQSTGLKIPYKQPLDVSATDGMLPNESVAPSFIFDSPSNNSQKDDIPQYKPFYQLKDSLPTRATCFHPTGEVFVVGSNSKKLRICMYPSEEELKSFSTEHEPTEPEILFKFVQIHRGSIYCVEFNDTGNLLATGSNDQTVHVIKYDAEKHLPGSSEYKLTTHSGTVRDLCFIHNGGETDATLLASGGAGDCAIHLTDCNTMKPVQVLSGHEAAVMSLYSWDESPTFVSGSLDGTIRLWDIRSRRCVSVINKNRAVEADSSNDQSQPSPVGVVRVEPAGKLLVSGHKDGRCMFYDIRGGRVVQMFKTHDDEIRTLNFSPKSYYLLTASYDHKVKLIDLQGDLTSKLPSVDVAELEDKVVQTAWHPNEYTFVTTSANGNATLWTMPEQRH